MSEGAIDLEQCLLDIAHLSDAEADAHGEDVFHSEFISRHGRSGVTESHDGEFIKFFADRYHHAFHTSPNRACLAYSKAVVARDRIERIQWIKPIVQGMVPNTECWEVPLKVPEEGIRCFPGKRLYVSWEYNYVIWIEPLRNGGFKFSTAYVIPSKEISRYTQRARKIWAFNQI